MPNESNEQGPTSHETSQTVSPTDVRRRPRFESILPEETGDVTGTIRRNRPPRPPAISTDTTTYDSFHTADETVQPQSPEQNPIRPKLHSSGSSIRHNVLSTEPSVPTNKQKKPGMGRKASSKYPAPYKGQEFSVDDDPSEYESDFAQRQSTVAKTSSGSLRRMPSTLRRRPTLLPSTLPRVDSHGEEEAETFAQQTSQSSPEGPDTSGEEGTITGEADGEEDEDDNDDDDDDDDADLSDAESFTLRDRQQAINATHPFGIRIWKPALYKKNRSVEKTADGDIHSSPGGRVNKWLWTFNILWTLMFGWWLALAAALGASICFLLAFAPEATQYGKILWGLARYLFWPFGMFVKLRQDETYAEEDEGEGRSISEYEQWQSGDLEDGRLFFGPLTSRSLIGQRRSSMDSTDENDSLLGRTRRSGDDQRGLKNKRRLFGRGQWTVGRVIFFLFFYFLITPLLLITSGICWFMVFWIPMGKVTLLLFYHLRRHPLAMSFHSDHAYSRGPSSPSSSILLCTYRAVGLKYWKYTIDGTNIFLINLIGVVLFVIFDYWVLDVALGLKIWLVHPGFVFALALFSIIPLAYFIGQAVASISAQSSMGLGAAINAFFSTIVEVFLYCVALNQGKGQLVEGSIIGSIFAGVLFLPGLSMCFGAIKRKTQRFNVKSAGATSTMLLFAVIAAFGPTLFYQIYGSHELKCHPCKNWDPSIEGDCRRCYFSQVPAVTDRFFAEAVRPYCWFAALLLFMSYIIGLLFTLRTHAAVIWNTELEEKKLPSGTEPSSGFSHQHLNGAPLSKVQTGGSISAGVGRNAIRDSQLYKRILGQSLKQVGLGHRSESASHHESVSNNDSQPKSKAPYLVPPKSGGDNVVPDNASQRSVTIAGLGLSEEENNNIVRQVAEMAATAAAVAASDATRNPRKVSAMAHSNARTTAHPTPSIFQDETLESAAAEHDSGGGHDAPNWSRLKSSIILCGATVLYAVIAEILVNTVDVVLESVDIDEKFLGITLFALVPNTTEFLNAISFAMNGNIALSMEIGSAYALQVCLLQIPALVLFSAIHGRYIDPSDLLNHTFNLIFPQWDMVTVILCVFLLSYMYGEGKSNYFKGSILVLTYLVIIVGFYLAGYSSDMEMMGIDPLDTLAVGRQAFQQIPGSRAN